MKNLMSWDMASHPRSLEYTVMGLWHIVCNVAARFLCLVKAYIIQAYVSASRGHRSHYPQSLIRFFLEKIVFTKFT